MVYSFWKFSEFNLKNMIANSVLHSGCTILKKLVINDYYLTYLLRCIAVKKGKFDFEKK